MQNQFQSFDQPTNIVCENLYCNGQQHYSKEFADGQHPGLTQYFGDEVQ
jgi:hypothetical protein